MRLPWPSRVETINSEAVTLASYELPQFDMDSEIGSVMSRVPLLADVEGKFDVVRGQLWLSDNIISAVLICVVYVAVIYVGRRVMEHRDPYRLRRALLLWNVGLAMFSTLGMAVSMPELMLTIYRNGFTHSCCKSSFMTDPRLGLWALLFIISKPVELGDTIFIVLRKSPLQFLHWYHHVTVLVYSWYGVSQGGTVGHWFGAMNFTVHSVMYTYYAFRAAGVRVPTVVARSVTVLQLSQMFIGVMVCSTALYAKSGGMDCDSSYNLLYGGHIIYISYFALFANFYYYRYCRHSKED